MGLLPNINLESFQITDQLNQDPENLLNFIKQKNKFSYVFIDEIQILENPSHFLKYIYDFHQDRIKLIVTSSANLEIKAKLQNSLVGRKISFYISHLSLDEILEFNQLDKNSSNILEQNKINKIFNEYLLYGGLPDIYLEKDFDKKQILLKEYIGTYVNRDIRNLIKESNIAKFNKMNIALANLIGNLLNKNELANDLNLDNRVLERYLDLLEFGFIFNFLPPYFSNPATQIKKMNKVFCFDLGVRNAILNNFSNLETRNDQGRIFENFIYLILKNKYKQIFFWRTITGSEVDFVYQKNGFNIIEIKFKNLTKPKIEKSFFQAIKNLQPKTAKIINLSLNNKILKKDLEIKFMDWKSI